MHGRNARAASRNFSAGLEEEEKEVAVLLLCTSVLLFYSTME